MGNRLFWISLLLLFLIPRQGHSYWPPLQDVKTSLTSSNAHWEVFDPSRGQVKAVSRTRSSPSAELVATNGVVLWRQANDFEFSVYDPVIGEWISATSAGTGVILPAQVRDGFVCLFQSASAGASSVTFAAYDPLSTAWRIEAPLNLSSGGINSALLGEGVLGVAYTNIGSYVLATTYDARAHRSVHGTFQLFPDARPTLAITNSTLQDNGKLLVGYDSTYQLWQGAPTKPVAFFSAGAPVRGPQLGLWFADQSLGATNWTWDFGDGTISSERSPYHEYKGPGEYRITQLVTSSEGTDSFSAILSVPKGQNVDCSFENLESQLAAGVLAQLACTGTIVFDHELVIRTNVLLASAGGATLSGGNVTRLFRIAPGGSLILSNLTLMAGAVSADPNPLLGLKGTNVYAGAIWNQGGTLIASHCAFIANTLRGGDGAVGSNASIYGGAGGNAYGGAIMSSNGVVQLDNCLFTSNRAQSGNGGTASTAYSGAPGDALGGAIYLVGGALTVRETRFEGNQAIAGKFGEGNLRYAPVSLIEGGAVAAIGTGVRIVDSRFLTNSARDGSARGGALFVEGGSSVSILNSDFLNNLAQGGLEHWDPAGNGAAYGGAIYLTNCAAVLDSSFCAGNRALGGSNLGGHSFDNIPSATTYGGAICNLANLTLQNSAFLTNSCVGTRSDRLYVGGAYGGEALGGAVYNGGILSLQNSTFALNTAKGGAQPPTPPGLQDVQRFGAGGALLNSGSSFVVHCTFSSNSAFAFSTNFQYVPALAGSIGNRGKILTLGQSILAHGSSNNYVGTVVDAGDNLSTDQNPVFSTPNSRNLVEPLLAPFRFYRGRTPTMALLPGSPAIDAVKSESSLSSPTDQRGESRPFGPAADIGAYEVTAAPTENVLEAFGGRFDATISLIDNPGQTHIINFSRDLRAWRPILTNVTDELGRISFAVPLTTNQAGFYRASR